jgi:ABC-type multidrug transport system fused ATPase/permease subunit
VRAELAAVVVLSMIERLLFALAAIRLVDGWMGAWAAAVGSVLAGVLRSVLRQRVTIELRTSLTMALVEGALLREPLALSTERTAAEAAIFEGRHAAEQIVVRQIPATLADGTSGMALLFLLAPADGTTLLVTGTLVAALAVIALLRIAALGSLDRAWAKSLAAANDAMTAFLATTELVASGREQAHIERTRSKVKDWTRTTAGAEWIVAVLQRAPVLALGILAAVVAFRTGSFRLEATVRLLVLIPPLSGLARSAFDLLRASPKLSTLSVAYNKSAATIVRGHGTELVRLPCRVSFEEVEFGYGPLAPVLFNLSFFWNPGSTLGIRGPNGSGKSTILRLILGLVRATSGNICIDGRPLHHLDLHSWRQRTAYLPQRPYLPDDMTVRDLMQLTITNLSDVDAVRALQTTEIWPRLQSDDGAGLATPLGKLSTGEKQRVVLARMLAQPADVLILDEPDENLDSEGRSLLVRILRQAAKTKMIVLAAHDSQLLAATDSIIDLGEQQLQRKPISYPRPQAS